MTKESVNREKPNILYITTREESDHNSKYGKVFEANLPFFGGDVENKSEEHNNVIVADYRSIMKEFAEQNPDVYSSLKEKYPPRDEREFNSSIVEEFKENKPEEFERLVSKSEELSGKNVQGLEAGQKDDYYKKAAAEIQKEHHKDYENLAYKHSEKIKAPVVDINADNKEKGKDEQTPERLLKDFVKNHKTMKDVDGIAGPGDYYNVLGSGVGESPDRLYYEAALFAISSEKGIPLVGVCGTEQHMAYFAGAAFSDNVEELTGDSHIGKDAHGNVSGDVHAHKIKLKRGTGLYDLASDEWEPPVRDEEGKAQKREKKVRFEDDVTEVGVNSLHTTAVKNTPESEAALNEKNMQIAATDPTGKIVEGITNIHGAPVLLLQSHPEYPVDEFEKKIMSAFVDAVDSYKLKKGVTSEIGADKDAASKGLEAVREKGQHAMEERVVPSLRRRSHELMKENVSKVQEIIAEKEESQANKVDEIVNRGETPLADRADKSGAIHTK